MKQLPLLLLLCLISLVRSHGGCSTNAECATSMNHTSSMNATMEEDECCAYLSYMEKGTSISTTKMCMSSDEMKEYYDNYKHKIDAT